METYPSRILDKIVEEQIQRWQSNRKRKYKKPIRPVITISRLPGCDAWNIAKQLSENLEIDFFDQEIVDNIAQNADVSRRVVETVDEQDNSIVLDWLSILTAERHLWPNEYLDQLTRVIGTIGAHGHAVILGRGASYILPKEICLRVFVVAPLEIRIRNIRETYKVSEKVAIQNVMGKESERVAFIRRYFHANMLDPVNYDLIFNMEMCEKDSVIEMIKVAYNTRKWYKYNIN
ncbi:MAG TPA: cytidylate kinase-like family protein [Smithellaceae bacterium]|nr:cytidylate kinase-like family protein [Smithellaceae bacterium]HOG82612.1 cytidylate kinase-like family protein [Smithellaceae bacterium]